MKLWTLILFILVACNSAQTDLERISQPANAIIVQLGANTKDPHSVLEGFVPRQTQSDYCFNFYVDQQGNMYCTGQTNGSIGERNGNGNGSNEADPYIVKFDPQGNIAWASQVGIQSLPNQLVPGAGANAKSTGDQYCSDLSFDREGNVYCVGRILAPVEFPIAVGDNDIALNKFDSNGVHLWSAQIGEDGNELPSRVIVDHDGNIIVFGITSGEMVDGERDTLRNYADFDVFAIKFNPDGTRHADQIQLGEVTGGDVSKVEASDSIGAVVLNDDGSYLVAVNTGGSLATDNTDSILGANTELRDTAFWRVNKNLQHLGIYQKHFDKSDSVSDIVRINDKELLITGRTRGDVAEKNSGVVDVYVATIDNTGKILKKAQIGKSTKVPGGDKSKEEFCTKGAIDRDGNLYCAGITLGSLGEKNAKSDGTTYDIFVAQWDSKLRFKNIIQFGAETMFPGGDTTKDDVVAGIHIDYFGNLYLGGHTLGSLGETNAGEYDIFIFKMDMSELKLEKPRF